MRGEEEGYKFQGMSWSWLLIKGKDSVPKIETAFLCWSDTALAIPLPIFTCDSTHLDPE